MGQLQRGSCCSIFKDNFSGVRVDQSLAVFCISLFVVWSLPAVIVFSVLRRFTSSDSHRFTSSDSHYGISKHFVELFPESIVTKADKLLSGSFLC